MSCDAVAITRLVVVCFLLRKEKSIPRIQDFLIAAGRYCKPDPE